MQARTALVRIHSILVVLMYLALALPRHAYAVEVTPLAVPTYMQTDGPTSAIGEGDWYTSNANGVTTGYHYLSITVPCGWPASDPVFIDLFSPEIVVAAIADEVRPAEEIGNANTTTFELYGAGTAVGPSRMCPRLALLVRLAQ